jgi:hypothetical protein
LGYIGLCDAPAANPNAFRTFALRTFSRAAALADVFPPPPPFLTFVSCAFRGYGWFGFRFGRAGGMRTVSDSVSVPSAPVSAPSRFARCVSLCSLEKNFCACDRICTALFVPMCSSIFLHARPCSLSAARNRSCSSSVQRSRCFVMVYGLRTFATRCPGADPPVSDVPALPDGPEVPGPAAPPGPAPAAPARAPSPARAPTGFCGVPASPANPANHCAPLAATPGGATPPNGHCGGGPAIASGLNRGAPAAPAPKRLASRPSRARLCGARRRPLRGEKARKAQKKRKGAL